MKKTIFGLLLLLPFYNYGQDLSNCKNYSSFTVTDPKPFTTAGTCITIDKDLQIQNDNDFNIANDVTIIIPNGKTFTLSVNNIGNENDNSNFLVEGSLNLSNPTIKSNISINVKNTGNVTTSNLRFSGLKNTIVNDGIFKTAVFDLANNNSINSITNSNSFTTDNFNISGNNTTIVNENILNLKQLDLKTTNSVNTITNTTKGKILIDGNINISGTSRFLNSGELTINANYNNNDRSVYINCGTINAKVGFNLEGGRVVNTGTFTHGNGTINLGSKGSVFENFGNLISSGTVEVKGDDTLYNEGYIKLNNSTIDGGKLLGPLDNTKKGYFNLTNNLGGNNPKIGPNLIFNKNLNNPIYIKSFTRNFDEKTNRVSYTVTNALNVTDANVVINEDTSSYPTTVTYNDCPTINGEFESTPASCKKVAKNGTPDSYTTIGISTLDDTQKSTNKIKNKDWPYNIPNGAITLESKTKGLVLTRTTADKITTPVEGMLIYDIKDNCIKLYNGEKWNCITKTCNE